MKRCRRWSSPVPNPSRPREQRDEKHDERDLRSEVPRLGSEQEKHHIEDGGLSAAATVVCAPASFVQGGDHTSPRRYSRKRAVCHAFSATQAADLAPPATAPVAALA